MAITSAPVPETLLLIPPSGVASRLPSGSVTCLSGDGKTYAYVTQERPDALPQVLFVVDVASGKVRLKAVHEFSAALKSDEESQIFRLALSEDGSFCVSVSGLSIAGWKTGVEEPLWVLPGSPRWVGIRGGEAYFASRDSLTRVDLKAGHVIEQASFPLSPVAILDDGRLLCASYDKLKLAEFGGQSEDVYQHAEPIKTVVLGPNAQVVVAGKDTPLAVVVDWEKKTVLQEYDLSALPDTHGDRKFNVTAASFALNHSGDRLLVSRGRLWVLDAKSGDVLQVVDPNEPHVALMGGWKLLGFFDEQTALLNGTHLMKFDIMSGEEIVEGEVFPRASWSLTWSPNGTKLLSGHTGSVYLWDLDRGEHRRIEVGSDGRVMSAAFAADGKRAWALGPAFDTAMEIDVEAGALVGATKVKGDLALASANGSRIAVVDGSSLNLFAGSLADKPTKLSGRAKDTRRLAFDSPGEHLAAVVGKQILVWDVTDPTTPVEKLKVKLPGPGIQALAVDSERLLVFTNSASALSYDLDGGKCSDLPLKDFLAYQPAAFSPEGKLFLGSTDKGVRIDSLDGASSQLLTRRISGAAFSPDAANVAVQFTDDSLRILSLAEPSSVVPAAATSSSGDTFPTETMGVLVAGRGALHFDGPLAELKKIAQSVQKVAAQLGVDLTLVAAGDLINWSDDDEVFTSLLLGAVVARGGTKFPAPVDHREAQGTLVKVREIDESAWAAIGEVLPAPLREELAATDVALHLTCVGPLAAATLVFGVEGDPDSAGPGEYFSGQDMAQVPHETGVWGERVAYAQFEGTDVAPVDLGDDAHGKRLTELSSVEPGYYLIARYD